MPYDFSYKNGTKPVFGNKTFVSKKKCATGFHGNISFSATKSRINLLGFGKVKSQQAVAAAGFVARLSKKPVEAEVSAGVTSRKVV